MEAWNRIKVEFHKSLHSLKGFETFPIAPPNLTHQRLNCKYSVSVFDGGGGREFIHNGLTSSRHNRPSQTPKRRRVIHEICLAARDSEQCRSRPPLNQID
jgi:hypothetical protein